MKVVMKFLAAYSLILIGFAIFLQIPALRSLDTITRTDALYGVIAFIPAFIFALLSLFI